MVEQEAVNFEVAGSSPAVGAKIITLKDLRTEGLFVYLGHIDGGISMNHSEGFPKLEFIENPIREAEIAGLSVSLDAADDIELRTVEYNKSIQDQDVIRKLGAMLVGENNPSKQD